MNKTAATRSGAFVSILILTYNAPDYVKKTLTSLRGLTRDADYEIVVVDNASDAETRDMLKEFAANKTIDHLFLRPENTLFAKGNNIAAPSATHLLLFNSDIEILDSMWLRNILRVHKPGITACQIHKRSRRVDGWCFLMDAPLYRRHRLDENYAWWWP